MPKKKSNSQKYLKYSGLAMQLFGLNLIAVLVGKWADAKMGFEKGYISMLLILIFNIGFFYALYLDLAKTDKENED